MNILYYEIHITIEPVFEEQLLLAKEIAKPHNFKVAELLMKKTETSKFEVSKYDTFMTGHKKDKGDAILACINIVKDLQAHNFKIYRYKIEDVTIDSRKADILSLLKE